MDNELSRVVDALPGLVWTAFPDGQVDYLNQRWFEYTGLGVHETYGGGWQPAVHPEDLPELLECWRSILASGEPCEMEARLRRFDGEYRRFLFSTRPLAGASGQVVKWCGLNTDIEDRKRAEEALDDQRQAECLLAGEKRLLEMVAGGCELAVVLDALCRLFEQITSDCTCSVVLVDASGTYLKQGASPSLSAKFTESIDGRLVSVDNGPCAMAAYLNQQVISADIRSETRWGAYGWCELALSYGLQACWSTPISSRSGKVLGTFGLHYREPATPTLLHQNLIDQFTHLASIAIERAQNDAALKRSEAFLAEAQRLSSTGSFTWRVVTDEITWSDQSYRIFQIDRGTPVTFGLIDSRVHPEDSRAFKERLEWARRDGSDVEFDFRLLLPADGFEAATISAADRPIRHIHVVAHASRNESGQLEYTGAVQDVTERRRGEEALSKARSELTHVARVTTLGALTASIAHEVNQPLSGIITNASTCLRMLATDPPNVDGALETARRTIRDGNRAADVITRLRALFEKRTIRSESVDLNDATREVIALFWSELQRSRVTLRTELADDLPPVTGDRVQLQQVMLNLLRNATDAMSAVEDRPRQLVISTAQEQGHGVCLTVQDAGVGFEPQSVEKLFEAFYTTKTGGMGIGLFVSRSIIASHHGRLWAAANDGPGATFSFSIPRRPADVTGVHNLGAIRQPAAADAARLMSRP